MYRFVKNSLPTIKTKNFTMMTAKPSKVWLSSEVFPIILCTALPLSYGVYVGYKELFHNPDAQLTEKERKSVMRES